jgi:hypothetical protein
MNLINGSIGYVPPAELYDADTYTVWQTPFDRGSYERVLETMTREIRAVIGDGPHPRRRTFGAAAAIQTRPAIQCNPH